VAVVCTGVVFQERVFAPVPPPADAVEVPVLPPLQATFVDEGILTVTTAGCVIDTCAVAVHPLASVAVTVYVPAVNPVAVAVVCTGVVFQESVFAPVPPPADAVAVPLLPPLQATFVDEGIVTVTIAGCVIVTCAVAVHPLASVAVTVYVPAINPVAVAVVCTGVVFQESVFAPVPPPADAVAVPLLPPLQATFVDEGIVTVTIAGCVIVTCAVAVHPLASVAVTVYVPAINPVAVAVVCTGVVFQESVFAPVPPPADAVAVPVLPPLQATFVDEGILTVTTAGCVIDTCAVAVHPLASVAVTVYVPAVNPVAVAVV